ncbi:hypothetical protein VQ643_01820 [Pseudomonas sp. F1_0610]|uniref:hypothetical protein n=1 Tax=Pseudomonas sp. F1_0610 TaxID=3114284 RepID=UPI0039C21E79
MYLLSDVTQQIISGVMALYDDHDYDLAFIYKTLCFCMVNDALNDYSTYHEPSCTFITPRNQLLTGNESVLGDFLLLDYCGHIPEIQLRSFASLTELETSILGSGGIFNSFTTMQIPIIYGKFQPYQVTYRLGSTPEQVFQPKDFYQQKVTIEITDDDFPNSERKLLWDDLNTHESLVQA